MSQGNRLTHLQEIEKKTGKRPDDLNPPDYVAGFSKIAKVVFMIGDTFSFGELHSACQYYEIEMDDYKKDFALNLYGEIR